MLLTTVHDYLKVVVSLEMVNPTKDVNIFPLISAGSEHSTLIFDALQSMMKVHTKEKSGSVESLS